MKAGLYRLFSMGRKVGWHVHGYRRKVMFGMELRFVPETELSESIWFRYPQLSLRQRVVVYTDYVQAHSVVSFVESLPNGPVVLELGAYHGAYAVLLGALLREKGGRLIAVEASPVNAGVLRENIALNGLESTVEVIESFVMDKDEESMAFMEQGSQSTIDAAGNHQVRSESIATLLRRQGIRRIALLLMDIEGAEVRVLPAIPWDEVEIERIYCEMHPGEWYRFAADGTEIERVIREQSLICLDMYLNPFATFKANHYAGPAVLFRHADNR